MGISLVAPFAAIAFDEMEVFENGGWMEPDVEPHMFELGGGRLNLDDHYRELLEETGLNVLKRLRAEMTDLVQQAGITVLGEADLDLPVPWLRTSKASGAVTVREAFFFRAR